MYMDGGQGQVRSRDGHFIVMAAVETVNTHQSWRQLVYEGKDQKNQCHGRMPTWYTQGSGFSSSSSKKHEKKEKDY